MTGSLPNLLIVALASAGFLLAFYIRSKKHSHGAMVCPLGSDCNAVIHSEYSSFLGMPVEVLGMSYYAIIAVSYALFAARPEFSFSMIVFWLLAMTAGAFFFSLYLVFVQAFALRQWCAWCLTSALLSTFIFLTAVFAQEAGFGQFFILNRDLFLILEGLALALGVGGATFTDLFFFKFLRDLRISKDEAATLRSVSQVMWLAAGATALTGIGSSVSMLGDIGSSGLFIARIVIFGAVIANAAVMSLVLFPKFLTIPSDDPTDAHGMLEALRIRTMAFRHGAVSLVSWYALFILASVPAVPLGFAWIMLIYLSVIMLGMLGTRYAERAYEKPETLSL